MDVAEEKKKSSKQKKRVEKSSSEKATAKKSAKKTTTFFGSMRKIIDPSADKKETESALSESLARLYVEKMKFEKDARAKEVDMQAELTDSLVKKDAAVSQLEQSQKQVKQLTLKLAGLEGSTSKDVSALKKQCDSLEKQMATAKEDYERQIRQSKKDLERALAEMVSQSEQKDVHHREEMIALEKRHKEALQQKDMERADAVIFHLESVYAEQMVAMMDKQTEQVYALKSAHCKEITAIENMHADQLKAIEKKHAKINIEALSRIAVAEMGNKQLEERNKHLEERMRKIRGIPLVGPLLDILENPA